MGRVLGASDLQPTLPLVGNEHIYAAVTGIPIKKIKAISKEVQHGKK